MSALVIYFFAIILFIIAVGLYLLPSIIAIRAKRKNAAAIVVLNVFLGWTFLGWVGALIWSLVEDKQ